MVKPQPPEVLIYSIQQAIESINEGKVSYPMKDGEALNDMHFRVLSDKLQQKIQELERTNEELRDFVHIISHDFQEPLRKISIFSHRLDGHKNGLGEKGLFFLDRLQRSAIRMQDLFNDLAGYLKVVSTNTKTIQTVNLEDIIQKVLIDLEIPLTETKGKVEVESISTVQADPFQMRGLFQNLIANALKYHQKDNPPLIKIRGQNSPENNGFYEIRVQDNGIGFDEIYKSRIFKPFERLHREGEYKGTGMGLTLCKKIVERHGGSIKVESKTNEGTTFIINFPTDHK